MSQDNPSERERIANRHLQPSRRALLKQVAFGATVLPMTAGIGSGAGSASLLFQDEFRYTDSPTNHGWHTDTSKDSPCRNIDVDGEILTLDAGDSNHCNLYQPVSLPEPVAPRVEMRGRSVRDYPNGEGKVRIVITADNESIGNTTERVMLALTEDNHSDILFVDTGGERTFVRVDEVDSTEWQELVIWFDGDKTYAGTLSNQFLVADASPALTQNFRVYVSNGSDVTEHDWVKAYRVDDSIEVAIDVKPGSDTNPINPKRRGVIPVGILHTDEFDPVSRVDIGSLRFGAPSEVQNGGGASPAHGGHVEDIDDDGDRDLLLHFRSNDAGFDGDENSARLEGETEDGTPLFGTDDVKIVGGRGGNGGGPP